MKIKNHKYTCSSSSCCCCNNSKGSTWGDDGGEWCRFWMGTCGVGGGADDAERASIADLILNWSREEISG